MTQETGETRDAIIEDDNKLLSDIIDANKITIIEHFSKLFVRIRILRS